VLTSEDHLEREVREELDWIERQKRRAAMGCG